jgi:hypothetical protein
MGWVGRPDFEGVISSPGEYSHSIRFNSAGMHDTEHAFEKKSDVFRILWVGDSYVQAAQVAESQTAHQQLEDLLNKQLGSPEQSFEVISAGVSNWGTGQELIYYREQGRLYRPDIVILLFFIGNDVNDNLPGHALTLDGFNCFAPYFPMCDNHLDLEPWYYIPGLDVTWGSCSIVYKWLTSSLSFIQQHSYIAARIEPLLLSVKEPRRIGQELEAPSIALYLPQESRELQYGWRVTRGLLTQFNREVKADGTDFVVAIIAPERIIWLSQFTEAQLQYFYQTNPLLAKAKVNRPNQHPVPFLKNQGIPALDLQQPMLDYSMATGTQLYFHADTHWTVDGNRLAAQLIFDWLLKNNLLQTGM